MSFQPPLHLVEDAKAYTYVAYIYIHNSILLHILKLFVLFRCFLMDSVTARNVANNTTNYFLQM